MPFDTDEYARNSAPVKFDDLDLDGFKSQPLAPDILRAVRYMCNIEYHTVCYFRDMLVTPSHKDAEVTAFMTMWNMEEFWHGAALAKVLESHGEVVDYAYLQNVRKRIGWKDKLDPIKHTLLSNFVGKDFIALHMIWGAINEWSAVTAYNRLAKIAGHPVLDKLLRRIAKQETRHVAFYATQARQRLAQSTKAQKLARFALRKYWGPVGSGIMPEPEVAHMLRQIMGGQDGYDAARKIDESVQKMPGLRGLRVVERALQRYGVPLTSPA